MIKKLILVMMAGLLCTPILAQSFANYTSHWDNYSIRNLGVDDGMPAEETYFAFEDDKGFVWIANIDGLVRYDGLQLKKFNNGYRGGTLYEIHQDANNAFWIPSIGEGLYKFQHDSLIQFKEEIPSPNGFIKSMTFLQDGTIALGLYGSGLSLFDGEKVTKTFTTQDGLVSDEIWSVITDSKNRLWIGTNDGLSIFENGVFKNFTTENGLPYNTIRGLTEMSNGDIWIGTDKEGVVIFRDLKPFKYLHTKDGLSGAFPQYFAENEEDGSIWIAHHGNGLDRYKDGVIENITTEEGLVSDFLTFIGFSKDGTAYVGSETGMSILTKKLVSVINNKVDGIDNSAINSVNQDGNGTIWLGTDGNGFKYFKDSGWNSVEFPPKLTNGYSGSSALDNNGNIWFGTQGTGVVGIKNQKVFKKISGENGLIDDFSRGMAFDGEGNIWIGTNKGLSVYNPDFELIETYTSKNGLPNDFCITMTSGANGDIWFGSYGGGAVHFKGNEISVYDTSNGLSSGQVFSIYEHSTGVVFVGATGSGISKLDGEEFTYFGLESGLPPGTISGIAEDDDGNLWFATGMGIYTIKPSDLDKYQNNEISTIPFSLYSTDDGLPTQAMEAARNSTVKQLRSGEILFASIKGAVVINPERDTINTSSFFTFIDEFVVDEKTLDSDNPRKLTPDDKKIEISFSALNIRSPKKTKFRIKLDGIDEDWNYVGDRTTAYYDYLPDGDYIFNVSAIGPDGQWNDKTAAVSFIVLPPFYKAWWFISLCLLGFVAIGAGGVQIRSNMKLNALNRELLTQQKIQKERERISRELHDNVGSQITNLITGIEISNLHLKKNQQDKALSLLKNLDSDARGAMTDLRETIWLLDKEKVQFGIFLDHLKGFINRQESYLKGLQVIIHSEVDKNRILNPTQSLNLTRIIQEALNNTRKYAKASIFNISFLEKNELIEIQLTDNGVGMDADTALTKGNGLRNMKDRVEELNGNIFLKSDPQKGTSITITF